jgi:hypothetical protein
MRIGLFITPRVCSGHMFVLPVCEPMFIGE